MAIVSTTVLALPKHDETFSKQLFSPLVFSLISKNVLQSLFIYSFRLDAFEKYQPYQDIDVKSAILVKQFNVGIYNYMAIATYSQEVVILKVRFFQCLAIVYCFRGNSSSY